MYKCDGGREKQEQQYGPAAILGLDYFSLLTKMENSRTDVKHTYNQTSLGKLHKKKAD